MKDRTLVTSGREGLVEWMVWKMSSQKRKREQFEFEENTSTLNLEHRICGFFTLEEKPNFGDLNKENGTHFLKFADISLRISLCFLPFPEIS